MGLGKTIQGIGVAELLAQLADIRRVLVVCPASLKSQWRSEINRFCGRSCQMVLGSGEERVQQYESDTFFTICNYEQVLRDHATIERLDWDLIILDEGQRIKNWESKTSQADYESQVAFRLGLIRYATGESARRALHRCRLHRRSAIGASLSLLSPPPRGRRTGHVSRAIATWTSCAKPSSRSCCAARAAA